MPKLILGTATFNEGYGISNQSIKSDDNGIREIVTTAQKLGINDFDTAPGYGPAEDYLGNFLDPKMNPRISSKISSENGRSVKSILESVNRTLLRTKSKKLAELYLHDPIALTGQRSHETMAGLRELISLNLVERIGISVYDLDSLLRAKEFFPELNAFQVPENICDRRLRNSQDLIDLHKEGNVINVRSVFLQGMLLMPINELPDRLKNAKTALQQLENLAKLHGLLPLDICLAYAKSIPWASGVIVGAASGEQLLQTAESRVKFDVLWETQIATLDKEVLDPRRW